MSATQLAEKASLSETIEAFRAAMAEQGIETSDEIVADGHLHRVHAEGDRKGARNAWYCLHFDERPAGTFGCNKRHGDHKFQWQADRKATPWTPEERKAWAERVARERAEKDAAEKARHEAAAAAANQLWDASAEATEDHPYLKAKGVKAHGLRVGKWEKVNKATGEVRHISDNALLIPVCDRQRKIHSLQAIFPSKLKSMGDRNKDYLVGGAKRGLFHTIGSKPIMHDGAPVFVLSEGYATGASIHECTGHLTLVCFDAGNLPVVAQAIHDRFQALKKPVVIILAADNDRWTTQPVENPGVYHAKAAARAVNGLLVVPDFKSLEGNPTDFNDLHLRQGAAAVAKAFEETLNPRAELVQNEIAVADNDNNVAIPDNLGMPFRCVGTAGQYYAFWREDTRGIVLLKPSELGKDHGLFQLASLQRWEAWALDSGLKEYRAAAANWLIQTSMEIGFFKPELACIEDTDYVRRQMCLAQLRVRATASTLADLMQGNSLWSGVFWYDEFSGKIRVERETPWGELPSEWRDEHDDMLAAWAEAQFGVAVGANVAAEAVQLLAMRDRRDPVVEYLQSLEWDGVPRIDTWLLRLAGAQDTLFNRAAGKRTLIAGVARAFNPGCKHDPALVLEGPQGLRKSSLVRALAPNGEWFTDRLDGEVGSKDSMQSLAGRWIVELAEMTGMTRGEVKAIKGFMASGDDKYRPSYGRRTVSHPRRCIFIGTINPEGDGSYLTDTTGGRRFWPVKCTQIDLETAKAERDQLWAEAVTLYQRGEQWWLTDEEEAEAKEVQRDRTVDNPWVVRVGKFLSHNPPAFTGGEWGSPRLYAPTYLSTSDIFEAFTGRTMMAKDITESKLIASALTECGWKSERVRVDGRRFRAWVKVDAEDELPI
ncbi:toprim domain-containing protein [Microvirga terrae]|uniref:Toprim domain-containing protein n=1 Tax=Microvirga terrae TaxID=2740529 RepID=A0ABY5RVR2_9HYPH|nr:VapE domain-containing protein [Microvirga terrae]UVF21348.1 toprim domain-containing protein [Microvirga terrae]